MACSACGHETRDGAKFCDECGSPLTGAGPPAPAVTVPSHLAEKMRAAGATGEGERKQVTVMFADLMGSMDLAEEVDPERWRSIMDRFFGILCDGVHRFEGTVDKFTGDGIMALFGAPIAHEDHAVRAGYAALHLHEALAGYAGELRRTSGLSFSVRIGLNSGEVVIGRIGDDLLLEYTAIGHTVGLAQRMESLAEPGATYLTASTASLVTGYLELEDLGEFAVKGSRDPVCVHRLIGVGSARSRLQLSAQRGFSRFVGRADELATLEARLAAAQAGDAQVVGMVGEAGVGKSRLCHEFAARAEAAGLPVWRAAATAHGRTLPFGTALELLRTYFDVDDRLTDQQVRERVAGRLLLLDGSFAEELPLLFDFLGVPDPQQPLGHIDPEARQRRLLAFVRRLAHAQSQREPGLTVLEDLHWVDPGSELLLDALIGALPGTRAMVLANFRPEYRASWAAAEHHHALPVVPLGDEAIDELLGELLGGDPSLDGLADEIRARTGGNPFFIEEVVRTLAEEGVLVGDSGGYRLGRSLTTVRVPPTVQAVLAARIDRLPARDKHLLQAASVLGRDFPQPVLARVAELADEDLEAALQALVDSEFLHRTALYPEPEYGFRHPLTHEVAYGTQLAERRARVHAAVARAIEDLYADALEERAALLAEHWTAAQEPLHAARWCMRAAVWTGINSPAEALGWWRRVHELADMLPEDAETRSLGIAARTWILQFGWRLGIDADEALRLYTDGCALADRAGDAVSRAVIGIAYGASVGIAGDMRAGHAIQMQCVEQFRALGIPALHVGLSLYPMYGYFVTGKVDECLALGAELLEAAGDDPTTGAGLGVGCPVAWIHMMRSFSLYWLGDIAGGEHARRRALALAVEHGDAETEGWVSLAAVFGDFVRGDPRRIVEHAMHAYDLAESNGSPFSRAFALGYIGLGHMEAGEFAASEEHARAALALIRERRSGVEAEPLHMATLASALLGRGDAEGALAVAREAWGLTVERGTWGPGSWLPDVIGRSLTALGPEHHDEAQQTFDTAIAMYERKGWRPLLARVLISSAGLAAVRGDREAELRTLRRAAELARECGADGHAAAAEERLAALSAA